MSKFVDTGSVAVTDGDDVIYVKRRMDVGTQARVRDAVMRIALENGAEANGTVIMTMGAQEVALLVHNIVKWEGPGFVNGDGKLVPCNAENIQRLDPRDPHIVAVVEKIAELNKPREDKDPKGTNGSGSLNSTASATGQTVRLDTSSST